MADGALSGLKVLDFGWIAAVPIMTLQLAQHGAEVIRVESTKRPDAGRTSAPFTDATRTVSATFSQINYNKRSLGLDLKAPEARDIIHDLVRRADVVTENFRPGTLDRLGFGFEQLAAVNPRLVMVRSSSAGQTGPWSTMGATGDLLQSLCGFTYLTGEREQDPIPPWGAWTDITVPPVGVVSLLAAVRQARRTGRGLCLDMSQHELSISFLADAVLAAQISDESPTRRGNGDAEFAPHGLFRVLGDDDWIAVAVTSDDEWRALARVLDAPELAERWPTSSERRAAEPEIRALIEAWTSRHSADEAMKLLQSAGVPTGAVLDAKAVHEDPQLAHREYFTTAPSETGDPVFASVAAYRLSETPARADRAAVPLGADTWEICTEILGLEESRVAELYGAGVLE